MADNDNQKTVHTAHGMFHFFSTLDKRTHCRACMADIEDVKDKLSHKCEYRQLFNQAMQYNQMLTDIANNAIEGFAEGDDDAIIPRDTLNLARETLGWEKL